MIVAFTGYAGSGKDAAAAVLVDEGWQRVAFADPLKDVALAIGWDGKKDKAGRQMLQNLGASVRAVVDENAWVRAAERLIEAADGNVVVSDVRYENEAEMIRRLGGSVYRVVRPEVGPANNHASELNTATMKVDGEIQNDGRLGDLRDTVLMRFTDALTRSAFA